MRIGSTLNGATGFEMPLNTIRVPKSAEDTRAIVRTVLGAGADYVIFYDGAMPLDYYKAGVDEAHKLGKPAFVRAYGPGIFPAQAAEIGAAQLPHSAGVPLAIAKNPSQFRQGRDDRNELDKYADMDDAKAADLVKTLVAHHVALVPTFMINYRGYPKNWDRIHRRSPRMVQGSQPPEVLPGRGDGIRACGVHRRRSGRRAGAPAEGMGERQAIPQDVRRCGRTPVRLRQPE